eukprot:3849121-Rhodomonas_salina.1
MSKAQTVRVRACLLTSSKSKLAARPPSVQRASATREAFVPASPPITVSSSCRAKYSTRAGTWQLIGVSAVSMRTLAGTGSPMLILQWCATCLRDTCVGRRRDVSRPGCL